MYEELNAHMKMKATTDECPDVVKFLFDKGTLYAHRSALTTKCDYFAGMFRNENPESNKGVVDMRSCPDVSLECYDLLLRFVFADKDRHFLLHGIEHSILIGAMKLAKQMVLPDMETACKWSIIAGITPDNVTQICVTSTLLAASDPTDGEVLEIVQGACTKWARWNAHERNVKRQKTHHSATGTTNEEGSK